MCAIWKQAAAAGNARAQLALDVFIAGMRQYLGAYLVELGGADVIVFTGGIGENGAERCGRPSAGTWTNWASCSIRHANATAATDEAQRNADSRRASRAQIWVMPTNEEIDRRPADRADLLEGIETMFVAKVTGSVVATQKVESMVGHKLLVVEPYRLDPQDRATAWSAPAATFVAVDTVGAGEGEFVLITQGSSARLTPETKNLPIDTVIIGIVDTVHVEQHVRLQPRNEAP